MRNSIRLPLSAIVAVFFLTLTVNGAEPVWPQWRGPAGTGHSTETGIPHEWDAKSIVWKLPLKGVGQSTPVIWGERIFLTSAPEAGKSRLVVCVDRKSGKVLWEKVAWTGSPELSHAQNGWASATCATDGERVVAFFGKGGLHCYGVDGTPLWSREFGNFPGEWGTAASPIIMGDLVIQNCDAAGAGLLVAVNKKDGKDVWKTPRTAPERGGWTTPVLVDVDGKKELVVNGEKAVTSYDPEKGTQLWSCKSFAGRGDPTVTPGKGLVFVVNGVPGDIYAVKPGGSGDVTKSHMAWHTPRKSGRDQPSPILVGDYLVVASMTGMTTCYKAIDGSVLWTERLKGAFSASPIAVEGKVFFQNEAGETTVIEPGPKFKFISQNFLSGDPKEVFRAALSPCAGQIFTRSDKALYCIGKK